MSDTIPKRPCLASRGRNGTIALVLTLSLGVAGCAATPHPAIPRERLLDAAAVFGGDVRLPEVPDAPILEVTDEMRAYVADVAGDVSNPVHAVDELVRSLFAEQGRRMEYDQAGTLTAAETFAERRGNCLAYSNLLVALAREMGLHAEYREVEIPPTWDEAESDLYIYDQHVNVGIARGDVRRVFDVNAPGGMNNMMKLHSWDIPDSRAFAQYYSNLGVGHLIADDLVEGFRYFRKALRVDPDFTPVWVNLGILFRRAGKPDFAEAAYHQVLLRYPNDYLALSNLARLYEYTGDRERAAQIGRRVEHERLRNPYYRYHLALEAFDAGQYEQARNHLLAAIRELDDEPRLYLFLGAVNLQLQHAERAESNFRSAQKLASSSEERQKLGNKAKMLKAISDGTYQTD